MRKGFWMVVRWHVGELKEAELDCLPEMKRINDAKMYK